MPRKKKKMKRFHNLDVNLGDKLLSKFVNIIMKDGKKSVAEKIVYSALDTACKRLGEDSIKVFKRALENVKPQVEVRSRRVGGSNYQVPMDVRSERRLSLGLRWLRDGALARGEKKMASSLAIEIYEAYLGRGSAVKRKDEAHKAADSNRAYAHLKWQ
ncbi:MAG: 30S ribosomal protein S7 [Deltaproteobacteria bacterium]|nr:MAG: 30S ribosomal protein S7 [Deltaproteobacteria bacterium]